MKNLLIASLLILPMALTSCTRTEKNVALGAGAGAVVGGLATGRVAGAATGAIIGGIAMVLVSKATRPGYCVYKDKKGRKHEARCQ